MSSRERDIFHLLAAGATFRRSSSKHGDVHDHTSRDAGITPALPANPSATSKKRKRKRKQSTVEEALDVAVFRGGVSEGHPAAERRSPPRGKSNQNPEEEWNIMRKAKRIKTTGGGAAPPIASFDALVDSFKARGWLVRNLKALGYTTPTPVQMQAIPSLIGERDLLGIAPTGSGKTLAFLVPCLVWLDRLVQQGLMASRHGLKVVIVSPTRELASQTGRVLDRLDARGLFHSSVLTRATAAGTDFSKVDILLATPMRLSMMVKEGRADLSRVRFLILDEADKLFEQEGAKGLRRKHKKGAKRGSDEPGEQEGKGSDRHRFFLSQMNDILVACKDRELTCGLFSATLPSHVEDLARNVLRDPLRIQVGKRNTSATTVKQKILFVGSESGKVLALRQLLKQGVTPPVLVFVDSKKRASWLRRELMYDGVHVDCIHSDQSNSARTAAVANFRMGETWLLIATDLVGRGMDFLGVNLVVNFDFPKCTMDYIHRVGRTGRAGRPGESVTFCADSDLGGARIIANLVKEAGGEVPGWMLSLGKGKGDKVGKA